MTVQADMFEISIDGDVAVHAHMKRNALWLSALFVLALAPRLYSAQTVGWHWDYPGSFGGSTARVTGGRGGSSD